MGRGKEGDGIGVKEGWNRVGGKARERGIGRAEGRGMGRKGKVN